MEPYPFDFVLGAIEVFASPHEDSDWVCDAWDPAESPGRHYVESQQGD
jgi:hypothetical protein